MPDPNVSETLRRSWMDWRRPVWSQPLDEIRSYFGEKVALYFAWLGYYSTWLIPLCLFGIVVWIQQLATGRMSVSSLPVYGVFVSLWSVAFLEFWKRRQTLLATQWGMTGFEKDETARMQFKGDVSEIREFPVENVRRQDAEDSEDAQNWNIEKKAKVKVFKSGCWFSGKVGSKCRVHVSNVFIKPHL